MFIMFNILLYYKYGDYQYILGQFFFFNTMNPK